MSELSDNIKEFIVNSQDLIQGFQKEAQDAKAELEANKKRPLIEKEAAIQVAGTLIGKGLIPAENLNKTIESICADPLGVITEIAKVASVQPKPVPSMGQGSTRKSGSGAFSKEDLSNADKALLKRIHLI